MKNRYCPNGNYWEDVTSIWDSRIYYFCTCKVCKNAVYELRPINITKKVPKGTMERLLLNIKLKNIKRGINYKNMEAVEKII